MTLSVTDLYVATSGLRFDGLPDRYHDLPNRKNCAIGIMPGADQGYRLTEAPINSVLGAPILVAGTNDDPAYTPRDIVELLDLPQNEQRRLFCQGFARHTPDQMEWLVSWLLSQPKCHYLILSTAAYHLPRCILTFIKTWQRAGDDRRLQLQAAPTIDLSNPKRGFGSGQYTHISGSVEEEMARITTYQDKGDVATAEEFFRFVEHGWG